MPCSGIIHIGQRGRNEYFAWLFLISFVFPRVCQIIFYPITYRNMRIISTRRRKRELVQILSIVWQSLNRCLFVSFSLPHKWHSYWTNISLPLIFMLVGKTLCIILQINTFHLGNIFITHNFLKNRISISFVVIMLFFCMEKHRLPLSEFRFFFSKPRHMRLSFHSRVCVLLELFVQY